MCVSEQWRVTAAASQTETPLFSSISTLRSFTESSAYLSVRAPEITVKPAATTGNRSSRYTTQCVDTLEQSKDVGAALLKLSNKISLLPRHIFQLLLNFPSKLENCVCFKWSFYSKIRPYSSQFIWSMWDTEV